MWRVEILPGGYQQRASIADGQQQGKGERRSSVDQAPAPRGRREQDSGCQCCAQLFADCSDTLGAQPARWRGVYGEGKENPMATAATKSSRSKRKTRRTGRRDPLAVKLLKADHKEVEGWFDEYEQLDADNEKLELFNKIALALKVHTQIEEEIFYPEERGEVEDDVLDEAFVEHASAKTLIAEIEAMKPGEEFYDAKVKVLGEYIKHHVKEEEQPGGIFAQAKKGEENLDAMGERLKARKEELMQQLGGHKQH
jgi:hypothetical protein